MNIIVQIIFILVIVSLFIISHYAVLFLALAIIPGILSLFLDKRKERYASKTIIIFNFMGMMPFIFQIWFHHNPGLMSRTILLDIMTWVKIYLASIFGWVVIYVVPNAIANFISIKADIKERKLTNQQAELIEEWGENVRNIDFEISDSEAIKTLKQNKK